MRPGAGKTQDKGGLGWELNRIDLWEIRLSEVKVCAPHGYNSFVVR